MSEVQLIIRIENDEQADKVLAVLNEAEAERQLDFAVNVERREIKTSPHLKDPSYKVFHSMTGVWVCDNLTFSVGDDGEPMI